MGKSKRFNQIQCKEDLRKTELIIRNQTKDSESGKKKQATHRAAIRVASDSSVGKSERVISQSATVNQTKPSQSRRLYLAKLFFTDGET